MQKYFKVIVNPKFCYLAPRNGLHTSMGEEVSRSLGRKVRFIHPKFFYDEEGSKLFEEICSLPEYYLTRSEMEILDSIGLELSQFLVQDYALIELGSGSAKKTRLLLEVLTGRQESVEYYPIDISDVLKESSASLQRDYKNLKITGILGQYESGLDFIKSLEQKKLIAFLGSSLGNFDYKSAIKLLKKIHDTMNPKDLFLLGLDLVKDKRILENAYDDFQGVTSRFNLNLLTRINNELGGNFDLKSFEHLAFYNSKHNRIEMHLRSKGEQEIFISKINLSIKLKKSETILTEYSYKYTIPQIEQIANKVGFKIEKIWYDKNKFFSLILFSA
ncbi:MAG: L-histidine N(alpha)-methyltransferase [Thaumarchaeota archaeon]|nr:L-histidine N(alpha)-methyltransferase [Nitrososphaerota archaeon]